MSQTKANPHKLSVRQKAPGISVGANTKVELDGKPLKYVKFLKLEFHSARVTKVTLEMFVEVEEIDVETNLELNNVKSLDDKDKWVLGEYCSMGISPKDQTSS